MFSTVKFNVFKIILFLMYNSGPGSVVGVATGYGLDCPGIESRWGRAFPYLYRPALGPTQPPVQWVPGLFRCKERLGRDADPSTPSSAVVKENVELYLYSPMGRTACTEPQCLYKVALYPCLLCILYFEQLWCCWLSFFILAEKSLCVLLRFVTLWMYFCLVFAVASKESGWPGSHGNKIFSYYLYSCYAPIII